MFEVEAKKRGDDRVTRCAEVYKQASTHGLLCSMESTLFFTILLFLNPQRIHPVTLSFSIAGLRVCMC